MAEKVRLSCDVSKEFNDTINRLSEELDCSKSGVFRRAIALYQAVSDGKKQGLRPCIVDSDNNVVSLIIGL